MYVLRNLVIGAEARQRQRQRHMILIADNVFELGFSRTDREEHIAR